MAGSGAAAYAGQDEPRQLVRFSDPHHPRERQEDAQGQGDDDAGDDQIVSAEDYIAALGEEPARVAPVHGWPATMIRPEAVTVSYVISPLSADHLAAVSMAIRLIVGHWYRNREAVVVDQRGIPTELPLGVEWLLRPVYQFSTS